MANEPHATLPTFTRELERILNRRDPRLRWTVRPYTPEELRKREIESAHESVEPEADDA